MRERLRQLAGALDIESSERGTRITASLPIDQSLAPTIPAPEAVDLVTKASQASGKRILIVDDFGVVRLGVRRLIEDEPDLTVCGEAADGIEAIAKVRELNPDLVLMDLQCQNMGGFRAGAEIHRVRPSTKIFVLTLHSSDDLRVASKRANYFQGYLQKSNAHEQLIPAIRTILKGATFFPETRTSATAGR
jgi:DNA-binding NarL/FixJ family response regulator